MTPDDTTGNPIGTPTNAHTATDGGGCDDPSLPPENDPHSSRALRIGKSRESPTKKLICDQGLGYCCEWFFWTRFNRVLTGVIALRLGVTDRTIRRHRVTHERGDYECKYRENCMKHRLL